MARIIKKTMMMMTPPTRTRISPDGRRGRKQTMRPTTMQLMAMRTATKTMMTMPVTMVMTIVMTVAVIYLLAMMMMTMVVPMLLKIQFMRC